MKRERMKAAIKSLEEHAVTEDEMVLINYLKINLGNIWRMEDDEGGVENDEGGVENGVKR